MKIKSQKQLDWMRFNMPSLASFFSKKVVYKKLPIYAVKRKKTNRATWVSQYFAKSRLDTQS